MKKVKIKNYWWVMVIACMAIACRNEQASEEKVNAWENGKAQIPADENLQYLLRQFEEIFEHEYPNAGIEYSFQPNDSLIQQFADGKIHCMIITRMLTENEEGHGAIAQEIKIKQNVFAYSGIALVAGNAFKDSVVDLSRLKEYLSGQEVELVFDNARSGIAKFIMQKLSIDPASIKNAKSAGGADAVISYVQQRDNAVGFIPFSYISDATNQKTKDILAKVKLLDVKWDDTIWSVSQETIAFNEYPLRIPFNFVLGGKYDPLADGFKSYLFRRQASKILLRAGLVPASIPSRDYHVTEEFPTGDEPE